MLTDIAAIKKLFFLIIYLLLALCSSAQQYPKAFTATYNGHSYDIYVVEYPKQKIKLYWKDNAHVKMENLGNVKKYEVQRGQELLFATNAGMFTTDNSPKGLYIEQMKQLTPIDLSQKETGNFYMQPNGVFLLTAKKAAIVQSRRFAQYKDKAMYATQSGPMLVYNGVINKQFTAGSANTYIRSGVGIDRQGRVVFAISDDAVNFYDFASLYKQVLQCSNALYLDGAISKTYLPALGRMETGGSFGAMIGVVK